jgi:hypothetical protein
MTENQKIDIHHRGTEYTEGILDCQILASDRIIDIGRGGFSRE